MKDDLPCPLEQSCPWLAWRVLWASSTYFSPLSCSLTAPYHPGFLLTLNAPCASPLQPQGPCSPCPAASGLILNVIFSEKSLLAIQSRYLSLTGTLVCAHAHTDTHTHMLALFSIKNLFLIKLIRPFIMACLFVWRRKWQPTPVFLPGRSHGQRSLAGCRPWGRRVGHDSATKPPPPPSCIC